MLFNLHRLNYKSASGKPITVEDGLGSIAFLSPLSYFYYLLSPKKQWISQAVLDVLQDAKAVEASSDVKAFDEDVHQSASIYGE